MSTLANGGAPGDHLRGARGVEADSASDQCGRDQKSSRHAAATGAARARARRAWCRTFAGAGALGLVLAALIGQVWRHAEIRAVSYRPTVVTATALPTGTPAATLAPLWSNTDHTAIGTPAVLDVVVTYSEHTVTGRDAHTGQTRWSYGRRDRRLCTAVVQDGTVRAIYAHDGNCDEVTGLSATTGARQFVRTLFTHGTDLRVSTHAGYVLITAPGSLDLFQAGSGDFEWWFDQQPAGCATRSAVLGSDGVLIASACGDGDTLSLHSLQHKDTSAREWTVKLAGRSVLSADSGLSVLSADHRSIQTIDAYDGHVVRTVVLHAPVAPPTRAQSLAVTSVDTSIIATGNGLLGFSADRTAELWQLGGLGLPSAPDEHAAAGAGDELLAPGLGRIVDINVLTGASISTRRVPMATVNSSVTALGPLVLLGGQTTTMLR